MGQAKPFLLRHILFRGDAPLERKTNILERAVRALDLPADLAGLPRVELLGDREVRVEYHKGILAYGPEEIHVSGGKLILRILGSNLELRGMNATELCITGQIQSVELT